MSKPQKKQTAKAFTYSKAESKEILRALDRAGSPPENTDDCLHAITSLARSTLAAQPQPSAHQIQKEIRRVGEKAAQLRDSLSKLSPHARLYLDSHLRNDSDPFVSTLSSQRLGSLLVRIIEQAILADSAHPFRSLVRPKEAATRSFILGLCVLYYTATGRLPRRQIDPMTGKPSGRFWAFVKAAIGPTRLSYSDHSVDHHIREALNQFGPAPPAAAARLWRKSVASPAKSPI